MNDPQANGPARLSRPQVAPMSSLMTREQVDKPICPRCETEQCFGPDDKSCSDLILVKYREERDALRQQLAAVEKSAAEDRIIMAMSGNQTEYYANKLATTQEQLRLCNIDQLNTRAELAAMTQERDALRAWIDSARVRAVASHTPPT